MMNPKYWLILEIGNSSSAYVEVHEFSERDDLNKYIGTMSTEGLISLEVISGFSLTKRVQQTS